MSHSSVLIAILAVATVASGVLASPAEAQQASRQQRPAAQPRGTIEVAKVANWGVYTSGEGRARICFVQAQPTDRQPRGLTRDPAYLSVAVRVAEGARNEVSVITGFPLRAGGEATAAIGSAAFDLVGRDKNAWLKNPAEETRFVNELRRGTTLTMKATSVRGNVTTDRYPLAGFGQALERATKECS
jgi:invasion protein IalB